VNSFVERQIATLLNTNSKEIDLQFVNVKMQYGGADCGLFAIAFATALALGHAPEAFHFQQDWMRQHLRECLEHGAITMFPYDKTRRANKKIKNVQNVYCTCRLPEFGEMIQCSCCIMLTSVLLFPAEQKYATLSGNVLPVPSHKLAKQKK
jgi:hypothetical protein